MTPTQITEIVANQLGQAVELQEAQTRGCGTQYTWTTNSPTGPLSATLFQAHLLDEDAWLVESGADFDDVENPVQFIIDKIGTNFCNA